MGVTTAWSLNLPWPVLRGQRSYSRLRSGLLVLSHLNRKESRARYQHCLLCDQRTLSPYMHVLTSCSATAAQRFVFWHEIGECPATKREQEIIILSRSPGDHGFNAAVHLADELDESSRQFFKNNHPGLHELAEGWTGMGESQNPSRVLYSFFASGLCSLSLLPLLVLLSCFPASKPPCFM